MRARALTAVAAWLVGVTSCSGRPPRADAPPGADAGSTAHPRPDAGPTDAGRADAGPFDAGAADAGEIDRREPDAGQPDGGRPEEDAGPSDAGRREETDAGHPGDDAGIEDAGHAPVDAGPLDAGEPDAGVADAGSGVDAGAPFDAGPPNTVITVSTGDGGWAVPDDFVGISLEWSHVVDYLGDGSGGAKAQVIHLLSQFAADGHHPVLRIGGDSEDQAVWNPDGGALPSGASVSIGYAELGVLADIANQTGAQVILGLNLNLLDPGNEAELVSAALATLPSGSVLAFELGNEPDLYFYPSNYRPFYYSPLQYQSDFDSYFPALTDATGGAALFAAPAFYGTAWYSSLSAFLGAESGRLDLVTMHRYPYSICVTTVGEPTPADLFSATATTDYATQFQPVVQTAAASALTLRIAEMNSVSCGGEPGVSDVFAAGLWGLDVMFELASIQAVGVNFHTPSNYPVFDFDSSGNLEVRGLYYALLTFSRGTAQHGAWLPTTVESSLQVRAWSTLGSDGATRVTAINEDLQSTAVASVVVPGATPVAGEWLLSAPSITATTQITLGGETFAGSTDGNPIGSAAASPVVGANQSYAVVLPPGSAVVLEVPSR